MFLLRKLTPKLVGFIVFCFTAFTSVQKICAQVKKDSLPFPIQDRRGDFIAADKRTFDLNQPSNIKDSVAYDPETKRYYVYEKIGSKYYRTPSWYTFDEFMALQAKKDEREYFQKRANTLNLLNMKFVKPKLSI